MGCVFIKRDKFMRTDDPNLDWNAGYESAAFQKSSRLAYQKFSASDACDDRRGNAGGEEGRVSPASSCSHTRLPPDQIGPQARRAGAKARTRPRGYSCRGQQRGLRALQQFASHFPGHRREALEKFLQRVIALHVFKKRLHRNARAFEYRRTAQNVRVDGDQMGCLHPAAIALDERLVKRPPIVGLSGRFARSSM